MDESKSKELVFAFDDSEIIIENIPHTIIAGVGPHDPIAMNRALTELKSHFGLSVSDELKWNGMNLPQRDRELLSEQLLSFLNKGTTLVMISEGLNREVAARLMAQQLSDYFTRHPYIWDGKTHLSMIFDEGIICDASNYNQFLKSTFMAPVSNATVLSVKSHENALIQLADVAAGFNRLVTAIALGRPDKQIEYTEKGFGYSVKTNLSSLITLSQRWETWGEVPPPPDPENVTFDGRWPFKHVGGHGVRIISTISPELVKTIYDSRIVYMGCMH